MLSMRKTAYFIALVMGMTLLMASGCRSGKGDVSALVDTVPMLVLQIQKCSRLYTTEYRIHKIVTHDDVVRLRGRVFSTDYDLPLPVGERKVAIPMDATLKAYIDFSDFSSDQVQRRGRRVIVTLPDPRVVLTESKIDQEGIREYVALMRSHFSDRELSVYEQQGREAILSSIPELGIIEAARASAARLLVPILVQMGFKESDITITFSREYGVGDIRKLLDTTSIEQ